MAKLGDPNDGVHHDGSSYCMDLSSNCAATVAVRYKPWYQFLYEQQEQDKGYLTTHSSQVKDPTRNFTHCSMNQMKGGFYIDDDETFLKVYARLWSRTDSGEQHLYIVEKPTKVFRLFIDFDFKQMQGLKPGAVEGIARVAFKVVKTFWPDHDECIVCCSNYTSSTTTDSEGLKKDVVKTGIHMHWPTIFTTSEILLHLRESILATLHEEFGSRFAPMNTWEDVFDKAPYDDGKKTGALGSGLRLVGSLKADYCPNYEATKRKKKCDKTCTRCYGRNKITADGHGRPYMLFCVLTSTGRDLDKERAYLASFESLVLNTCIRHRGPATPHILPAGAPLFVPDIEVKRKTVSRGATKQVDHGDPVYGACEQAIRSNPLYAEIVVNNVAKHSNVYLVHVTGLNCRYCQNVSREHKSNRIWFTISKQGVSQKCHDDGVSPEQKHGPCMSYTSSPWALPGQAIKTLYPQDDDNVTSFVQAATSHRETAQILGSLISFGDRICKDLYKKQWSASLLFNNNTALVPTGYKNGISEYVLHYPDHIGTKHNEAFRKLGFPELVTQEPIEETESKGIPGIESLLQLEEAVLRALHELVDFACFTEKLNDAATFTYELVPSAKRRKLGDYQEKFDDMEDV